MLIVEMVKTLVLPGRWMTERDQLVDSSVES